jgi:hypothetical protein
LNSRLIEELSGLDTTLASLCDVAGLVLFPLNERMLARAVELSALDLSLQPFDQAILAAVLVRAEELGEAGETDLCLCETDADLQPSDEKRGPKQPLTNLYDAASLWVYQDLEMKTPERPDRWGSLE